MEQAGDRTDAKRIELRQAGVRPGKAGIERSRGFHALPQQWIANRPDA
jgi:hypothetical protein